MFSRHLVCTSFYLFVDFLFFAIFMIVNRAEFIFAIAGISIPIVTLRNWIAVGIGVGGVIVGVGVGGVIVVAATRNCNGVVIIGSSIIILVILIVFPTLFYALVDFYIFQLSFNFFNNFTMILFFVLLNNSIFGCILICLICKIVCNNTCYFRIRATAVYFGWNQCIFIFFFVV